LLCKRPRRPGVEIVSAHVRFGAGVCDDCLEVLERVRFTEDVEYLEAHLQQLPPAPVN